MEAILERLYAARRRFQEASWVPSFLQRRTARVVGVLVLIIALYYPVGMIWVHKIDDDLTFKAPETKGSQAVATAAALIDREVNQNRWVANDPFFMPGAALDNMPNFQLGVIHAVSRFINEMRDQIGRTRGSSQEDSDLDDALGRLQFPGDQWVWDPKVSLWPTTPAEAQYNAARRALLSYNDRLAAGEALFERRGDNLLATLDRIAGDLGAASAKIDARLRDRPLIDTVSDDVFYATKGRLYAYTLLLRDLGTDFAPVIAERQLTGAWTQLLVSLDQAASLQPWWVVNGNPDGQILPNHLAAQGFYLLRARTQLREVSNILLK